MLEKLIKYDLKWINKVMLVYYVIFLILTACVKIVESFKQTFFLVILDKILSGMFISCIISIMITCMIRIWGRFISNIYKDESYLTHTLPVEKSEIFNSKVLSSIISLLCAILVILIGIAIIYIDKSTIATIKDMYQSLVSTYGSITSICFVTGFIVVILLEVFFMMLAGIFGITIGYSTNNGKIIKAIIVGIGSYGMFGIITLIVIKILDVLFKFQIESEGFPSLRTLKMIGITTLTLYLIYDLIYYFVSKNVLCKGVNID